MDRLYFFNKIPNLAKLTSTTSQWYIGHSMVRAWAFGRISFIFYRFHWIVVQETCTGRCDCRKGLTL